MRGRWAVMRDDHRQLPAVRRMDGKLLQRNGRPRAVRSPIALGRRLEGGERRAMVMFVEHRMSLDETRERPYRFADAARFGGEIVFEPAGDPDAGGFLVNHATQR